MKKNEIVLDVGGTGVTAFLHFHEGFYRLAPHAVPFHRHQYTEVHCTERGEVVLATAEESFLNRPGTITAIPPGTVHRLLPKSEGAHHFAALLGTLGVNATVRRRLGTDVDAACGQLRRARKENRT